MERDENEPINSIESNNSNESTDPKDQPEPKESQDAIRTTWNGYGMMLYEYQSKWGLYVWQSSIRRASHSDRTSLDPRVALSQSVSGP